MVMLKLSHSNTFGILNGIKTIALPHFARADKILCKKN
jgi:hypothetical protein